MGQRLAACFFRVRNISLIRCTARSRITSGSPVWWYGFKLPHTHTHTRARTRARTHTHSYICTTLYFHLCLQFVQPAACLLLVCIASHTKLPRLQFLLALAAAVAGVMRWCSWVRYPGWPGALVSGVRYMYMHRYLCRIRVHIYTYIIMHIYVYIQGVPGGKDLTSGECSLGQTIPI
jgi:hypothetical protein